MSHSLVYATASSEIPMNYLCPLCRHQLESGQGHSTHVCPNCASRYSATWLWWRGANASACYISDHIPAWAVGAAILVVFQFWNYLRWYH